MVTWTSGRSEWTFNQSAANGKKEPIGSNVGDGSNGSYLAITYNTYYSGKTGKSKYCSRCRSMQLLIW